MVNFTDEPVGIRRGAPRVHIPDEIADWCEHTYAKNKSCEVPLAPDSEEAAAVLRALRIYASRQDKAISHKFRVIDGEDVLRFRMRDKHRMTRTPLEKEK